MAMVATSQEVPTVGLPWQSGDGLWLGAAVGFGPTIEDARTELGDPVTRSEPLLSDGDDPFDDFDDDDFDDEFDDDFEEDWEDDLTEDDEFPDTFGGEDKDDDEDGDSPFSDDPDFDD